MSYTLSTASPFLGGLNTELNKLVDSTDYTSDELNCMIRQNNTRSRRPGIDYEQLYKFNNEYIPVQKKNLAFNCIEWTDVNSPDESVASEQKPYIVVQVGGLILFYENKGQPYSGHQLPYSLDLYNYALDTTSETYMTERCKFTTAYGCLFITSKAIRPIMMRSAAEDPEQYHPVTEVPSGRMDVSVPNQYHGGVRPVDDYYGFFKINNIQVTPKLTITGFGNTPYAPCSGQIAAVFNALDTTLRRGITAVPKYPETTIPVRNGLPGDTGGEAYRPEDYIDFIAPDGSGVALRDTKIEFINSFRYQGASVMRVWYIEYEHTAVLTGGSTYHQQEGLSLMIRDTTTGATDYLEYGETPEKMSYAHLYNLINQGWTPKLLAAFYAGTQPHSFPGNNLAQQYLKDEKTEAFKPEKLINMTFGNTPAPRGTLKLHYFDQTRVTESALVESFSNLVSEIVDKGVSVDFEDIIDDNWELDDPTQPNEVDAKKQVPNYIPRHQYCADVCAYAGRIFYLTGDVLLYSQVIAEDIKRASYCYTDADPTSEEVSDVVETDGGLISLPEIGEGLKLAQVGDSLLVFGTKGNMVISGTANNIFTATAYSCGAINAVPTSAPDSFVDTEYGVFYWGTTGVQIVGVGDQGLTVKDISTEKILTFFGKISTLQHRYCKGLYSSSKKKVYWFYPSNLDKPRSLDLVLVYDIQRDAFMPYKITSEEGANKNLPELVSGLQIREPFKSVKEYPLYAEMIVPEDTVELKCIKAVSEEYEVRKGTDCYLYRQNIDRSDMDNEGCLVSLGIVQPAAISREGILGTEAFDIVTAFKATPLVQEGANICNLLCPGNTNSSASTYSYIPNIHLIYEDSVLSLNAHGNTEDLEIGKKYWIRATRVENTYTVKVLKDTSEEYTLETIGDAPSEDWTTVYTATGSPFTTYNKYVIEGFRDRFQGKVYLKDTGNLVTGYKFGWLAHMTTETFYYNRAVSPMAYSDPELTEYYGNLNDIIRRSHVNHIKYMKTGYYTWLRQSKGIPHNMVSKPWYGSDKDWVRVYMREEVADQYPNYTSTRSGDINLSSDVDGLELLPINGMFKYLPVELSGENIDDPIIMNYSMTYSDIDTGTQEITTDDGYKVLADDPLDTEEFTYESSILVCLDPTTNKITFGDFLNNGYRDWAEGDITGDGYVFDSYLISHPANSQDFLRNKTMPYLISYFKRTEVGKDLEGNYLYPTRCQGSVLWDWRTDGDNGKWDKPNELYRYRPRTILSEGYIITKTNIRGIGRSFQVRLHSVEDNNFVIESLGFNLQHDERI